MPGRRSAGARARTVALRAAAVFVAVTGVLAAAQPASAQCWQAGSPTVNESAGTASVTIRTTSSISVIGTVRIAWQTQDGTATAGADYTAVGATDLTWNVGENTSNGKTATVTILDDSVHEQTETFKIQLSNPRNIFLTALCNGTVTITDDDEAAPPPAPSAPSVAAASTTSLTVSWNAPVAGPPITGYGVRYKPSAGSAWTAHAHSGTETGTTIENLTPGTSYDVQVNAVNDEGTGDWSPSGTGTTTAAAPTNSAPLVRRGRLHHTDRGGEQQGGRHGGGDRPGGRRPGVLAVGRGRAFLLDLLWRRDHACGPHDP